MGSKGRHAAEAVDDSHLVSMLNRYLGEQQDGTWVSCWPMLHQPRPRRRLWSWRTVAEPGVPKETQQIARSS